MIGRRYATLSLFSGIGAFDFGLEACGRFRTVAFVEKDEACQRVLRAQFPGVAMFGDVREVTADALRAVGVVRIDAVAGGFPCQPHSNAGQRRGRADDRHLWPEFARIIGETRPAWVIAENVPGIRTTAADEVLGDLETLGYAAGAFVVGADDVGAPHRRKRVWFVGNAEGERRENGRPTDATGHREAAKRAADAGDDVADGGRAGLAFGEGFGRHLLAQLEAAQRSGRDSLWPRGGRAEPGLGGDPDGAAAGMDGGGDDRLWPTPEAGAFGTADVERLLERRARYAAKYGNNGFGLTLGQAVTVEQASMWPTPSASLGTNAGLVSEAKGREGGTLVEAVSARMWATPTVHGDANRVGMSEKSGDGLRTQAIERGFPIEPWERGVPRVVPRGTPNRTARLQQLGNAVVWVIPAAIGAAIAAYDMERGA